MTAVPPPTGWRVLVMRALHQAGTLSEKLKEAGAEPVVVPVLEMRPPASYAALDAALGELAEFDWLILTSANAVEAVAKRAELLGVPLGASERLRLAAVGRATAKAAEQAGFRVDLVPEGAGAQNSEGVSSLLRGKVAGKRVLLARAAVARDVIPQELGDAGARMTVVDAYRTEIPKGAAERLREALQMGVDAAAFTSSSSVKHLAELARAAEVEFPLAEVRAVSIGPVTSATLRELGWEPAAEAREASVESLVEALQGIRELQKQIPLRE